MKNLLEVRLHTHHKTQGFRGENITRSERLPDILSVGIFRYPHGIAFRMIFGSTLYRLVTKLFLQFAEWISTVEHVPLNS